jgi:hypothetical protein
MIDLATAAKLSTTFAAGAAGCFTMLRFVRMMEEQKKGKQAKILFPNGERKQIIDAIDELKVCSRNQHVQYLELRAIVERVLDHLKMPT